MYDCANIGPPFIVNAAGGFGGIASALHVESPSKQLQLYGSEASE